MVETGRRCLECFVTYEAIEPDRSPKQHRPNLFTVFSFQKNVNSKLEILGRTEVTNGRPTFSFCKSIMVYYNYDEKYSSSICSEVYHSAVDGLSKLQSDVLVGRAVFQVSSLLDIPEMHFTTDVLHPTKKAEVMGRLFLNFEAVLDPLLEEELVEIDLASSILRRKEWPKHSLAQSFEILRAHVHDDADNQCVWLPVYRSDRSLKQKAEATKIEFPRVTLTKRHICNGDEERRLRIVLQIWDGSAKKGNWLKSKVAGYIDFTLRDLCEVDPTKDRFEIEANGTIIQKGASLEIGFASIEKAEPTEVGSFFSLLIHYASTSKFVSSSADRVQAPSRTQSRAARHAKRKIKHIDSSNSSQGPGSCPNSFFSQLSYHPANLRADLPCSELLPRRTSSLFSDEASQQVHIAGKQAPSVAETLQKTATSPLSPSRVTT
jgi:hypothetical protein